MDNAHARRFIGARAIHDDVRILRDVVVRQTVHSLFGRYAERALRLQVVLAVAAVSPRINYDERLVAHDESAHFKRVDALGKCYGRRIGGTQ